MAYTVPPATYAVATAHRRQTPMAPAESGDLGSRGRMLGQVRKQQFTANKSASKSKQNKSKQNAEQTIVHPFLKMKTILSGVVGRRF